tara:strand:- start:455 stop:1729 length:1275 start_codon:yes stop_codon:yes gene_type:complete
MNKYLILFIFIIIIYYFSFNKNKEDLCIIGGGLSGIIASKQLKNKYNVTLFDENKNLGGANYTFYYHNKYIDNGVFYLTSSELINFNVFNLLNKYNIELDYVNFSYSILNYSKYVYKKEIKEFLNDLELNKENEHIIVYDLLKKYRKDFVENYIIPISTIILACDLNISVADFYYISKILPFDLNNKPNWIIPKNSTRDLIEKLSFDIKNIAELNTKIISVRNVNNKIEVITNKNKKYLYDKVIFCIRFDQINNIYKTASNIEKEIYNEFKYYNIETIIHTDKSILEEFNNLSYLNYNTQSKILTVIPEKYDNIYISLLKSNSINNINRSKILDIKKWRHLELSKKIIENRKKLHKLQGKNKIYYSGIEMNNSWIGIENSILSGYYVSELLGVSYPSIFNSNKINNIGAFYNYLDFKKRLSDYK